MCVFEGASRIERPRTMTPVRVLRGVTARNSGTTKSLAPGSAEGPSPPDGGPEGGGGVPSKDVLETGGDRVGLSLCWLLHIGRLGAGDTGGCDGSS